ncbi:tRNA uridine-5-carboxymethylaminomethyl(34) synthesis GTPase MnmE [Halanaerobium sp. Z-7514]|uniref:tRNA modification GTPase MnmE n=1 Tax=Halanaerobium polyolivorans TaxID=2886943 RepID=A0AAW4X034_9FIRM|nr:tRNA uridine-5-carboxymethylaminomethyl(34) synthesis GTPase MnmE [Halanaerobium polyolivorans]MCC3144721.1 tRNA uridine-5-carboxymethylaminomethyl(34) synthesis GTPase MnmE [Halanaerobium polyolivorans]
MDILREDTIAAIATPFGTGGTGKIRISGPDAYEIGDQIFRSVQQGKKLKDSESYTAHYGFIYDPEAEKKIDEVVAIMMRKPRSFTGENVLEFDCHGGMTPLRAVLELVLANGARLAEPGEFSQRAFLNGRIDLAQAEAIIDIINSKTEKSLDIAVEQLSGKLSQRVDEIKEVAVEVLAHLEAAIDYPEDEIEGFSPENLDDKFNYIKEEIEKLLISSRQGKIYKEGLKTVIVGKPNVGKSSLLNYFLEEKRAIVTDIPGTTRDVIEEYVNLKGIPLKIIDTAGIRETADKVEKIGVERTRKSAEKADLVLFMLDISQGLTEEDLEIYKLIKEKPLIVIVNKTDLPAQVDKNKIEHEFKEHSLLWISLLEEEGLEELRQKILNEILDEELSGDDNVIITKSRHKNALLKAKKAIERVIVSRETSMPYDFLTIDLKDCLNALGEITGETVADDIIDRIFNDFCLGK